MEKKMKRRSVLKMMGALAAVCAVGGLTGCGKDVEKLLVGDWYLEKSSRLRFTIYDDGTVNFPSTYGLGKWSLVNKNQLNLSNFYGETTTLKIVEIDEKYMEVREVINGKEDTESIYYWHTEDDALYAVHVQ